MRLDVFLAEKLNIKSRTKGRLMIEKGLIKVDGKIVIKPSFDVGENNTIEIVEMLPFVSKGGDKLIKGIESFNYSVKNKVFLDLGASNGGFTHCLLLNGAKKVYAIDVGENQLDSSLAKNNRIVVMDNTNVREIKREQFFEEKLYCVSDLSFISLTLVIPVIATIVEEFMLLIKPQFECGKKALNKNGIVTSKEDRLFAINKVCQCAIENGFYLANICVASSGKNKNTEYITLFTKEKANPKVISTFITNNEY